jgi:hypothetical protein
MAPGSEWDGEEEQESGEGREGEHFILQQSYVLHNNFIHMGIVRSC